MEIRLKGKLILSCAVPSLGNPSDVDAAKRKRKNKEPDTEIEQLTQAVKDRRRGSVNKTDQALNRIEKRLTEVNINLREIIRLLKIKH